MAEKGKVVLGFVGVAIGLGAVITLFGLPFQVVYQGEELALSSLGRKDFDRGAAMIQYSALTYESYLDSSNPKHSMSIVGVKPVCQATISAESLCAEPFADPNENTTDASAAECNKGGKLCQTLGPQFQSDVEELHWSLRKLSIGALLCTPFVAILVGTGAMAYTTGGTICSGDCKGPCGCVTMVTLVVVIGGAFVTFLVGVGFALAGGYWVQQERSTVMEYPQVQRVVDTFGGSPILGGFPQEGPAKATYGWAMSAAIFFGALVIWGCTLYAYIHLGDCLGKQTGPRSALQGDGTDSSAAAAQGSTLDASEGSGDTDSTEMRNPANAVVVEFA